MYITKEFDRLLDDNRPHTLNLVIDNFSYRVSLRDMRLLALSLRVVDGVCNAGDSILAGCGGHTGVVAPEIDGVTG